MRGEKTKEKRDGEQDEKKEKIKGKKEEIQTKKEKSKNEKRQEVGARGGGSFKGERGEEREGEDEYE